VPGGEHAAFCKEVSHRTKALCMAKNIPQFGTKVVSSSRNPLPGTHLPHISVTDDLFTVVCDLLGEISSSHCEEGCCSGLCGFCYRTVAEQYQRRTNGLHFRVSCMLIRRSFRKFATNLRTFRSSALFIRAWVVKFPLSVQRKRLGKAKQMVE
jgi:hypothetical protein